MTPKDLELLKAKFPLSAAVIALNKPIPSAEVLWEKYLELASVHEVAKVFGTYGEDISRRLKLAGFRLNNCDWITSDIEALKAAYSNESGVDVDKLAQSLKRTRAGIVCKANDLGITWDRGTHPVSAESRKKRSVSQLKACNKPGAPEGVSRRMKHWYANNEHPKGMKGKHHSEATKEIIRQSHLGVPVPPERTIKQMKARLLKYGTLAPMRKKCSWKQGWREIGGCRIYARSRWEANYARYLEFLKQANEIAAWEHEPETFWFYAVKRGCRTYLPDFRVRLNNGSVEFHEVKGWMDSRSKTKLKRMKKYYPETKLIIRDAEWFRLNNRKLSMIIAGWEKPGTEITITPLPSMPP